VELHLLSYPYTMALNIKDPRTEELAAEVARLTSDTKTGAIRSALEERLERVLREHQRGAHSDRLRRFLVDEAWPQLPVEVRGVELTKAEREELLGIGADGV
jgi:antitoxin VapB